VGTHAHVFYWQGRGYGRSVLPYFDWVFEQEATGDHPVQDTPKGPDVHPVGFGRRRVMHFGRHVSLCASGGLQVCRGVGGRDTLRGTKVTDLCMEDVGPVLWEVEENVLVTVRLFAIMLRAREGANLGL